MYQKFQDRDLYSQQHDQSLLANVLVGDAWTTLPQLNIKDYNAQNKFESY